MYTRVLAALAALPLFSGCAIHPLPEDFSGVDTYHIVRQIRCEARETLRTVVIVWLENLARDHDHQAGDPIARRLVDQYKSNPDSISNFNANLFPGAKYVEVRKLINLFYDAGIAYSFNLTMTENNDISTDINLLRPLTRPKFTLGVKAGATRARKNNRTFTVTDTFSHLLTKVNLPVRGVPYCEGQIVQANYFYQIAGRIGIDTMVRSFIELTLFANLAGKTAAPGSRSIPTMADDLTFTTQLEASATPTVVFSPVGTTL